MSFGHIDRYEAGIRINRTPNLRLLATEARELTYKPLAIPGLQPVTQYRKPQTHQEWLERRNEMTVLEAEPGLELTTNPDVHAMTAESQSLQERRNHIYPKDLGGYAAADWFPEQLTS
jgi:hypothetical protein